MKMKIIAMGILFMVCLGSTTQAQVIGAKGGVSINNVSGMSGSDRVSGYGGLSITYPLASGGWYVQPEILYSGEGQRYPTALGDRILALSYIKVPVMFQYYPVKQIYVEL
ncbi:MAG: hypothetical protein NVSMB63_02080 [Sediminibacterium sp.]